MKILICLVLAQASLGAAKKVLIWEPAKVESTFYQVRYGAHYVSYDPSRVTNETSVHESIYIDAGEWLYHVSLNVTPRGILRLPDETKLEVAADGKTLAMRINGKQYTAHIEQRSRAGAAVTPPSSRR